MIVYYYDDDYGYDDDDDGYRDCKISGDICSKTEDAQIMYAWALNASGTNLPEGVGYKVGQHTTIYSLVLQVHYGHVEGEL